MTSCCDGDELVVELLTVSSSVLAFLLELFLELVALLDAERVLLLQCLDFVDNLFHLLHCRHD